MVGGKKQTKGSKSILRENISYLEKITESMSKVPGKINNKSNTMTKFHKNFKLEWGKKILQVSKQKK